MASLLIDADGVAFASASAAQKTIHWDDDIVTTHADLSEAKEHFEATLLTYCDAAGVEQDDLLLCFSCPTRRYFRHDLLPTYKGNRHGQPPLVLRALKEWAAQTYPTKIKPNLEADDVIGILATMPSKGRRQGPIIVSADKDLQQIPGLHMNARAPSEGVFSVSAEFAERFLWTQVLTGDPVDNYSGIPGIGPKRAEAILGKARPDEPLWQVVLGAYRKAKVSDEDFEVQLNVARILTAQDYNFPRKEPILWKLPKA